MRRMMNEPKINAEAVDDPWQETTFEGAELASLRHAAKLSFAEKLAWLEDAHRLALKFQETRRKMGLKTIFPDGHIEE